MAPSLPSSTQTPQLARPFDDLSAELVLLIMDRSLTNSRDCSSGAEMRENKGILGNIRQTCRRWCALVDGAPTFWTGVVGHMPTDLLQLTIARSSNLPLDIIIDTSTFPYHPMARQRFRAFIPIVLPLVARWASLRFVTYIPEFGGEELLTANWENLRMLEISAGRTLPIPIYIGRHDDSPSRLRHLTTRRCFLSLNTPLYDRLETLEIALEGFAASDEGQRNIFYTWLGRMKYLSSLDLQFRKVHLDTTGDFSGHLEGSVPLPSLKSLSVKNVHLALILPLIERAKKPMRNMCIHSSVPIDTATGQNIARLFAEAVPPADGISVSVTSARLALKHLDLVRELCMCRAPDEDMFEYLQTTIRAFCEGLPMKTRDGLKLLEIVANQDDAATPIIYTSTLRIIDELCPNITTLRLFKSDCDIVAELLDDPGSETEPCLFRHLKGLEFVGCNPKDGALLRIVDKRLGRPAPPSVVRVEDA